MAYFPMFIDMKNRKCLIIGGGRIALRKALVLQDFEAQITVVSPEIIREIKEIAGICCIEKEFNPEDLDEKEIVVAATSNKLLNHQISQECIQRKIPVNAVDQIEDCTFIFPSYYKQGEVVAAFSSGGQSPVVTQYLKQQIEPVLTPHLGMLAACLGSLRNEVHRLVSSEEKRKKVYQEILKKGLEDDTIPSETQIEQIIQRYEERN